MNNKPSPSFLERYVDYAKEITDAPAIFHEYMAYAIVSAISARKVWLPTGTHGIFPNIYIVLIAPSSLFRKTTSLSIAKNLIRKVNSDLILPNEFSQEKLLEIISQQNNGVFVFSEFKTLLSMLKRDYMAGTSSFLTDIYDCFGGYSRRTKAGDFTIEAPFVSIWAATTMEWFIREIKDDDIASGFLARFIFVIAKQKENDMPFPPPEDEIKREFLIEELKEMAKIKGPMWLSPEAKDAYIEIYKLNRERAEKANHDFSCIYQRLNVYLLKFSILNALMRLSTQIEVSDLHKAQAYVDYALLSIEDIVENNLTYSKSHALLKKVLAYIEKEKAAGISRSDLIWKCNVSSKELDVALKTLIEAEKIFERTVRGIKRDRKFYYSIIYEKKKEAKI